MVEPSTEQPEQHGRQDHLDGLAEPVAEPLPEGLTVTELSTEGWIAANMFVTGLKLAGPNFTQQKLIDALNKDTDFDAGGMIVPINWTYQHNDPRGAAGKTIPQVRRNVNAFALGARSVDPSIVVTVIFNGDWSMPTKEAEATNLLIDLKKRQLKNEDKLNYELNIGARKFQCTTIPIYRPEFGVVGAICINVDVNYLTDEVMSSRDRTETFFKSFCRTDMQLDENILSKDEYAKALKGKRQFKDESV